MISWSRIVWVLTGLVLLMAVLILAAYFYRTHWHEEKQRADQAIERVESLQQSLTRLQSQQQAVAEIDKHYTQELAKANEEIEKLRADLVTGRKRLYVKATCPKLPEITATSGVDDATAPRLADTVTGDYLTLISRLTQMQQQLEGLQDYVITTTKEQ